MMLASYWSIDSIDMSVTEDHLYSYYQSSVGLICFACTIYMYLCFKERLPSIMNNIKGQEVERERGCEGA